ncbi:MAG: rod-binding protein [bacterium]
MQPLNNLNSMSNDFNTRDMSSINIQNVVGMKISDKEKLKKTAQEFEAVFISQLLNTMDSTVEKSGFLSGGTVEQKFRSMMNQYIAQDISKSPVSNFGLAKNIYEQMEKQMK